jgi:hypothetical protein
MAADGSLAASYQWLDIEGISTPSGSATALDLSAGNYALAAKDYDAAGANGGTGYDGIQLGDLYVAANSFALGDLIYLDDQGNNLGTLNNLALTGVLNDGAAPTTIQFAATGTGLGGLIDVSVAGTGIDYASIASLNAVVGNAAVISA